MAALTADRPRSHTDPTASDTFPVAASTTIWAGAIVALNTSGYAIPATDTVGLTVVGIATKKADNSDGSNGEVDVVCDSGQLERELAATGLTQAQLGQPVFVSDDQTVTDGSLDGGADNNVFVGTLANIPSAGRAGVRILQSRGVLIPRTPRLLFGPYQVTLAASQTNANVNFTVLASATTELPRATRVARFFAYLSEAMTGASASLTVKVAADGTPDDTNVLTFTTAGAEVRQTLDVAAGIEVALTETIGVKYTSDANLSNTPVLTVWLELDH